MSFYETSDSWWPGSCIRIQPAISGNPFGRPFNIPLAFVLAGGDNTLAYISYLAQQLFEERGELCGLEGQTLDLTSCLSASAPLSYLFVPTDDSIVAFTASRGPEGKSSFPRPAATETESSYSNSKSASSRSGQSRFRISLLARDGRCLLTQAERSLCTSAHLVPVSRFDVYQSLLDIVSEGQLFATSMGFLIRDDLHRSYDRYEWSWYFKDGMFYAHFFALEDPAMKNLHGKQVDPKIEMRVQPREYIDPRLTRWHYKQCVLARMRGYSAGF